MALIDPDFAKGQLVLLTREWYMHPNGQLPAYEWDFCDVNPPVHAWAAWRVYKIERRITGVADRAFLERVFHKLLLNFTWWVNRKDREGHNVFQGGFLGLDNIGVFDRSAELPGGGHLAQADGTAWMGFYSLQMLRDRARARPRRHRLRGPRDEVLRALPVHRRRPQRHRRIGDPAVGRRGRLLLRRPPPRPTTRRSSSRSARLVGLIPLLAVETIEPELLAATAGVRPPAAAGSCATGRTWRRSCRAGRSPASGTAGCWPSSAGTG